MCVCMLLISIRYAWGDAWSTERAAQFNLAENAAAATDMPFMAYKLLRRMRLDRRVNWNKHWKVNKKFSFLTNLWCTLESVSLTGDEATNNENFKWLITLLARQQNVHIMMDYTVKFVYNVHTAPFLF